MKPDRVYSPDPRSSLFEGKSLISKSNSGKSLNTLRGNNSFCRTCERGLFFERIFSSFLKRSKPLNSNEEVTFFQK